MLVKRALLLSVAVALAGCGGGGGGGTTEQAATPGTTATVASTSAPLAGIPKGGCAKATQHQHPGGGFKNEHLKLDPGTTYKLIFRTNCGDFEVTLDQKASPNATASLVSLAQRGYFNDTYFHRIVPGFVIQGGDPTGTGMGGPGYQTDDRVSATASYTHGVVAMAKTGAEPAGTAGSQFFVVTGQDAALPPDYAVVGKVTAGLDVVDLIGTFGDPNELPTRAVVISKVDVES